MLVQENFPMIEVSIPSLEREVDESGKSTKVSAIYLKFFWQCKCLHCVKHELTPPVGYMFMSDPV